MLHTIVTIASLLYPLAHSAPVPSAVAQASASETSVHVYDISVLTGQAKLASIEARLRDPNADQGALRTALKEYTEARKKLENRDSAESVAKNIKRFLPTTPGPDFQAIALPQGQLAVVATPPEHAWIDSYLEAAGDADVLVDITVTIYKLEAGSLKELGITEAPQGAVVPSAEALKSKLSALDSAEVVSAPRIMVNPGAKSSLSVHEKTAFVKDCEVKLIGDPPREVIDPLVEYFTTGLLLLSRALPISKTHTAVHADVKWTQLRRLGEVEKTFGESKTPVTIQLPELFEMNAVARLDINSSAAIVVTSVDQGGDGPDATSKELVTVITAEQIKAMPSDFEPGK